MSLAVRVIPCLDVDAGRVVKGVHFENLRDAGDPVELAAEYYRQGADELTFLDVTASSSNRQTTYDIVTRTAEELFIPLTVGGGVRSVEDVDRLLRCGADKVGVNTAAINDPGLIERIADRFGSQVLVLSVDARREQGERHTQSGFEVTTMGGRKSTGIDAIWWVKRAEELGAGEILLNSMDADGTEKRVRPGDDPLRPPGGLDPDHRLRRCGQGGGFPAGRGGRGRRRAGRLRVPLRQDDDRRREGRAAGRRIHRPLTDTTGTEEISDASHRTVR